MKKHIIIIALVISLLAVSLIGCGNAEKEQTVKGYAIIHHWDGDEHVEFYNYKLHSYGAFIIYATDGRIIMGNDLILIFE